jgi:arylsulfatase A-like enzyme
MRVPLLFVGPGQIAGKVRIDAPVSTLDVAPTLLELVDLAVPAGMRGRSLAPLLRGDPERWQARPEYGESHPLLPGHPTYDVVARFPTIFRPGMEGSWRMVRRPPWKLIHVPGRPEGEDLLFHLESDPAETRDRSGERSDVLAGLRVHLDAFREEERASAVGEADAGVLPKEELEKLEALGYVE